MIRKLAFAAIAALIITPVSADARGHGGAHYGGGHHSYSHGGHYSGGVGSSHRGGHYTSRTGSHHYGCHQC